MNNFFSPGGKFSPFISGMIMAVLFAISAYVINDKVGDLKAYSHIVEKVKELYRGESVRFSWEEFFILGAFIGAFVGALATKQFKLQLFPEDHLSKGPVYYLTTGLLVNFIGGFLVMFGLIIAGDTFLKIWNDALGLFMIVALFILIMFIESVVIGTLLTLRIEEK